MHKLLKINQDYRVVGRSHRIAVLYRNKWINVENLKKFLPSRWIRTGLKSDWSDKCFRFRWQSINILSVVKAASIAAIATRNVTDVVSNFGEEEQKKQYSLSISAIGRRSMLLRSHRRIDASTTQRHPIWLITCAVDPSQTWRQLIRSK